MIDIIDEAISINNNFSQKIIPYHFLTRQETEPLIDLQKLDSLKIKPSNYTLPYKHHSVEDLLKLKYQIPCIAHLQSLMDEEKEGNFIYISMQHIVKDFKESKKDFYNLSFHKQFHLVLEFYHHDEDHIYVKNTNLTRVDFMKHQELARIKEKTFNLKYNLKKYYTCPCCLATLASVSLFYKDNKLMMPTKIDKIDPVFNNALILIKNDRINIKNVLMVAEKKFKSSNFEEYFKKIRNVCELKDWDYDKIIHYIYNLHYDIMKSCESIRDKNSNNDTWKSNQKRNLNSPTWRSNITVA